MSIYTYSPEKNLKLINERNISAAIEDNQIVDILEHPNQEKYGGQKIYVICVKEYVYLVPFVVDADDNIFLKTIIPSRKAKKKYV
jgi:hypothetical protein